MTNFNEMNWNELRKAAKEHGIKITNKEEVVNALNATIKTGGVSTPVETKEVVLEELGCIPGTEQVDVAVIPVVEDKKEIVNMLPVNTFIQHKGNKKFFRIDSYSTKVVKTIAVLAFKNKLSDTKTFTSEIPVEWIGQYYSVVTAAFVKAEMVKMEEATVKAKTQRVQAPTPQLEVNVAVKNGYRHWTVTDKKSNRTFKASEGRSVTGLIKSYEAKVNGIAVKVTEQQAPVANNTQYVCSCCNKPVNKNIVDFLGRYQDKVPAQYRGKVICYNCQESTGLSTILRKYRTANGIGVMSNSQVVNTVNGRPVF